MSRVMIVDDDRNVLNSIRRLIAANSSHCIETFENPQVALERMNDETFDVILSDYHMGKMNGVEFLEQSQTISPNSTRILLSGLADMAVLTQSINRCGVYHYIPKPWNDDELMQVVSKASHICDALKEKNKAADLLIHNKYAFSLTNFSERIPMDNGAHDIPCRGQTKYRDQIEAALQESFSLLGFEFFSYTSYVTDGIGAKMHWEARTTNFTNYPDGFLKYYERNRLSPDSDPILRMITNKKLMQHNNPLFGTWHDAYQNVIAELAYANKEDRARIMSAVSDMYTMACRNGVNFGIFMSLVDAKKHTLVHLGTGNLPENKAIDPSVWKTVHGIIQLCNQTLRHTSACSRCNTNQRIGLTDHYRLTDKQRDVLKTFLDDSGASIKSVSRIHSISIDSVNFHLRNIRQTLDKPRTSPHALAALAKNMDLI